MTTYAIRVTSKTAPGETAQAIVGTPEWAETNLGGEWVPMPDPYNPDPDDPRVYAGPGMKFDPGVVEQFVADEWTVEKGTIPAADGSWFYNTEGQLTWHNDRAWRNLSPTGTPNVWEPGVANWREYPLEDGVPVWLQPTGALDAYPVGFEVKHEGGKYRSLIPANTTLPTNAQFWEVLDAPPEPEIPAWAPWPGFGPTYQIGDQVTHNGQTWESTAANNVWEPGVFGWVVI
jgi:hypothetical protein